MAVCRRCGNQMADTAAACPACGELRYQPPQAAATPQYAAPAQPQAAQYPQPAQYPQAQQYAQPQQAYIAPQAAAAYAIPVTADEAKGFVGALFDLSFTTFITTKLIRVLYVIAIVLASIYALMAIGYGFTMGGATGAIGALIISPLVFFAVVICARVYMELVIVIFRAAEHLAEIAKNTKR